MSASAGVINQRSPFQNAPEPDFLPLAPDGNQPQDSRQRARYGEIRAKIHADQNCVAQGTGDSRGVYGCPSDQSQLFFPFAVNYFSLFFERA